MNLTGQLILIQALDLKSFGSEKALPGAAYISSPEYKDRFGQNSGIWLVVTTAGERRMENLMSHTKKIVGTHTNLFYFTLRISRKLVGRLVRE